ncbi:MAG: SDR family oxidoreductase [Alphaproteobacteria bacterium]|nr:SDR family oxidoreductase [Alphaproteobacteria bacterium]
MNLDLTGKRVIITAGGSGIGRKTAEVFSAAGARVYTCDIDQDALESARGGIPGLKGERCDVGDPNALDDFFGRALDSLGGLDILVNNAGTAGPTAPVEEVSLDDWNACLTVNLTSVFLGTQKATPALKASGGGSIVNLSSAAGKFGFPLRSPYSAAKFAIVGFTRTCAMELGPHGIRVNCIQPGPVEGDRIDRVIRAKAEAASISENAMRSQMAEITSMKTFVTASDIAHQILFICSEAGRHITGQSLSVDAGLEGLA